MVQLSHKVQALMGLAIGSYDEVNVLTIARDITDCHAIARAIIHTICELQYFKKYSGSYPNLYSGATQGVGALNTLNPWCSRRES